MPVRSRRSESRPPSTGIRHPLRHLRLIQRCCPAARRSHRHLFLARYVYALTSSSSSSSILVIRLLPRSLTSTPLSRRTPLCAMSSLSRSPLVTHFFRDSHQTIYVEYRLSL